MLRLTDLVGIKTLEQINHLLEELADFFLWGIVAVALGVNGVDAGAVLAPFVGPEGLVIAVDINPIVLHV